MQAAVVFVLDSFHCVCEIAHRVKMKLQLAATTADETVVTTDAIMDGDHVVLKECSQHGVIRSIKCNNKGYKGTEKHEA